MAPLMKGVIDGWSFRNFFNFLVCGFGPILHISDAIWEAQVGAKMFRFSEKNGA